MITIIICGDRFYTDVATFLDAMAMACDEINGPISKIVTGSERTAREIGHSYQYLVGIDDIAICWANNLGIEAVCYRAHWETQELAAGPVRNKQMLSEETPDLVLGFPLGGPGTNNMCLEAKAAGVPVRVWRNGAWKEMENARAI